jgi:hypothetical protein
MVLFPMTSSEMVSVALIVLGRAKVMSEEAETFTNED